MNTTSLRAKLHLDKNNFFIARHEKDDYTLTIMDGKKVPLQFTGLSRKHLYTLINTCNKAMMSEDESKVEAMFAQELPCA
jgi:hypothetical protein